VITTDVLIVGSGPAGGAASLFLSTYGVDNVVLSRYGWTANTPRAHITNQRTIELMRDMGIEDQVVDKGTAHHLMGETAFLHQPGRRGDRPDPHLGYTSAPAGRLHRGEPDPAL